MNVIPDKIDYKYIYYNFPVKNTVMDAGRFIRVGYSDSVVNLNGIYTVIPLLITSTERYFNKAKYTFEHNDNIASIETLTELEKYVLSNVIDNEGLEPIYNLRENLLSSNLRVYNSDIDTHITSTLKHKIDILVKISGIWISNNAYGLTFKFFDIENC